MSHHYDVDGAVTYNGSLEGPLAIISQTIRGSVVLSCQPSLFILKCRICFDVEIGSEVYKSES